MRVLHLGKFYPPVKGGMETILELICDRTSHEVQNKVFVANNSWSTSEERRGDVDVIRLGAIAKIGAVAVCPMMPFRLAREATDLIVLHEPNPMALLAYFLARPTATLIVWFHSEVIRPSWRYRLFYRPYLQFALARASRIVVTSPVLAASAPPLQEWQSKCVVIPLAVCARRAVSPSDAVARRADAIRREHNAPIVLFVGRLVAYKGVDVLLDAMRESPAMALIVGEGPQRAQLQQKASTLGIADRVAFLGEVDDDELAALYHACDVFVLPSVTRQEAFGVVQIEAMTHGKPVISTDLGTGTAWVNQHGVTGLVVPPADPLALRVAIDTLLAEPLTRDAMGAAGARRARSVFNVERMTGLTLHLYRTVMGDYAGRKTVA
jgi:glycosyltransferase involved in cell wall biosynthesis